MLLVDIINCFPFDFNGLAIRNVEIGEIDNIEIDMSQVKTDMSQTDLDMSQIKMDMSQTGMDMSPFVILLKFYQYSQNINKNFLDL